ncbi:YbhB/YbcL family Raf kinase inhibitor-like protein [Demequina aurantiaca]|uniref:YbhB/YbcL family Raf kinase inhibitor-like protein n=1 Tax=Demequina aurantiaca TaxID=676200 RepID=UPI003D337383
MWNPRLTLVAATIAALLPVSACTTDDPSAGPPTPSPTATESMDVGPLTLTSVDFVDGGDIPDEMTASGFGGNCAGPDLSPELTWSGGPSDVGAYAIVMLDSSYSDWVHWIVANIPAETTTVPGGTSVAEPAVTGRNGLGNAKYIGPCPNSPDHIYTFEVWALDQVLDLEPGFNYTDLTIAADGHVLEMAEITGIRSGPAE